MDDAAILQEAITLFKSQLLTYTYDDFVEGEAPYILLDEAAVNPNYRARFETMLRKRAKDLKVPLRTVDEILKARNQGKPFVVFDKQETLTQWDGQPIALRVGRYTVDENSIMMEDKYGVELVCPHPIMPTKRYINIESETEALEISFRREYWKSVVIDKGTLSSASTIVQLANHGISITSETARDMVKYINYIDDINRDLIPIERMSNHLGWINDKQFVPYVDGVKYDSQGQFQQMYKTIREQGDYKEWLAVVRKARKDGTVQARIALAASFASVLLSRFEALPFFVHLWSSQSGTGKTVTMEMAASVWGNPQVGAYCRSLKSTTVGLEQLAVFTCNMPLCLDELQTIQDKRNFDDIVYGLCEGSGKTRGAKNGGLRHSPSWKNAIITTGEMPIVGSYSKAGAMNRVIEIECDGELIPDAKGVHRAISANYGFAGHEFVEAITQDEVMREIEADQQKLFENLAYVGTDKQALSASILLAADHAAERLIFKDGVVLSESDIAPYLRTSNDVDTGRKAHEYLTEWVAENRSGFIINGDIDSYNGRTLLGCIDVDDAGMVKAAWIINKAFLTAMADGGFNPDSYLSWAVGKKLIQPKGKDKKVVKHIPGIGIKARCVCLLFNRADNLDEQLKWTIVEDANLPF